jgi:hypothetical protein
MLGSAGVIAMDTRVALVTVNVVAPETLPDVAVIVLLPAETEVADPSEFAALLIVATPEFEELQVTAVVRSCVVLSEYIPVAENCCDVPRAILELAGVTEMETRVALVTVKVAVPETLPDVAVIVLLPGATVVADPLEFAALLIAATPEFEELHVTSLVRSCAVLSE